MQKLFNQIKEKVREAARFDLVDSESDYEDELASELVAKGYPQEPYSGYGIIKPQNLPDEEDVR